jgi:uncharacterized protein HemX
LEARLERLRRLAQTLVGGLAIALIISIGISGWFAYRSLLQERINRKQAEAAEQQNTEIMERVDSLEQQLQNQKRQVERVDEQIPPQLETLTDSVNANQRQLQLLQKRIERIEKKVPESSQSKDGENNNNNNN